VEKWGMRENLNKDILWFIGKKESHEKLKKMPSFSLFMHNQVKDVSHKTI